MNHENKGYAYTYSAGERAELQRLREKYAVDARPSALDKAARLRCLDESVTRGATIAALIAGLVGTLILGFGMSLILSDLRVCLAWEARTAMLVGIAVGLVGMLTVLAAYPLYEAVRVRRHRRVAPEILRLTEELMSGDEPGMRR